MVTDKIRRASRSIGANLFKNKPFVCEYISREDHEGLRSKCEEIGRMLGKMLKKPESEERNE